MIICNDSQLTAPLIYYEFNEYPTMINTGNQSEFEEEEEDNK